MSNSNGTKNQSSISKKTRANKKIDITYNNLNNYVKTENNLNEATKDKIESYNNQLVEFQKNFKEFISFYQEEVKKKFYLYNEIKDMIFKISNNQNSILENYGTLKKIFVDFNNINKNISDLNNDFDNELKRITDIKIEIGDYFTSKNKNNNKSISALSEVNSNYKKFIAYCYETKKKLDNNFNKISLNQFNEILADARYDLKKSVIDYFTNKIVIQQNSFKKIQIKNENTNSVNLEKLLNMKKILLNIKNYKDNLTNSLSKNNLNKNYPLISNQEKDELNNLIKNIGTDYNNIENELNDKINQFKLTTQSDIQNLQAKISSLILELKTGLSTFTSKHNLTTFNDLTNTLSNSMNKELNKKLTTMLGNINKELIINPNIENKIGTKINGINNNNNNELEYVNASNGPEKNQQLLITENNKKMINTMINSRTKFSEIQSKINSNSNLNEKIKGQLKSYAYSKAKEIINYPNLPGKK